MRGQAYTWAIEAPTEQYYDVFRIFMTGQNSNGHWYLCLSSFEVYGDAKVKVKRLLTNYRFQVGSGRSYYGKGNSTVQKTSDISEWQTTKTVQSLDGAGKAVRFKILEVVEDPFRWREEESLIIVGGAPAESGFDIDSRPLGSVGTFGYSNTGLLICGSLKQQVKPYGRDDLITLEVLQDHMVRFCLNDEPQGDPLKLELMHLPFNAAVSLKPVGATVGLQLRRRDLKIPLNLQSVNDGEWFENLRMMTNVIHFLIGKRKDVPKNFFERVWKNRKDLHIPECTTLLQFQTIMVEFSFDLDTRIVQLLNRFCEKNEKTQTTLKPSQFEPDQTLQTFFHVDSIPLWKLQLRVFFLQNLNTNLSHTLEFVDISLKSGVSEIADLYKSVRSFIFFNEKDSLLTKVLEDTADAPTDKANVEIDRFKANKLKERGKCDLSGKRTVFGQLMHKLIDSPNRFRIKEIENNARAFRVVMKGQYSDDYGGPYREALDEACKELQSEILPLFIPCPNNRESIGQNQDKWIPNRSATTWQHMRMFEFLGMLMGLAIRSKSLLCLDLPSIIWKQLVNETPSESDVTAIDLLGFKILSLLNDLTDDISDDAFNDYIDQRFVCTDCDAKSRPIVLNGQDIRVTMSNREAFRKAYVNHRLKEFYEQTEAIQRGLAKVVPLHFLSVFTWQEIEFKVCGRPHLDVSLLQSMTKYKDCSERDEHIKFFWEMLRSRFDDDQRSKLIRFIWGRSRLPNTAEDFERHFVIKSMITTKDPNLYLPVAHTCFFELDLPRYRSVDVMYAKTIWAITHCTSIDADDTSAARNAARLTIATEDEDDPDTATDEYTASHEELSLSTTIVHDASSFGLQVSLSSPVIGVDRGLYEIFL